ncbi:MAG: competence type IV pilus major pilin ComGC [Bacilli bacterium]
MKKGFTLIEMIAVVMILGLLTLLVVPNIMNQISDKKDDVSEISLNVIYQATQLYMDERTSIYIYEASNSYCITLETLVNDGKLTNPLLDLTTGDEITLERGVKVTFNTYNDPVFELKTTSNCK